MSGVTIQGMRQSGRLFAEKVLAQYLDDRSAEPIPAETERLAAISSWVAWLKEPSNKRASEPSLEQQFNQSILVSALGYRLFPADAATAYPKTPASITKLSGTPDVSLGYFGNQAQPTVLAVVELKRPGTPFDLPQAREHRKTPVEQSFDYAQGILGTRWVLVSDMLRIRLYSIESDSAFEEFDLQACAFSRDAFRKLYFLLSPDALISRPFDSPAASLLAKSAAKQIEIRESFYATYFQIRSDLHSAIAKAAESITPLPSKDDILRSVQRLLDRMLFLYYCEDHPAHLIPADTVKDVTNSARRMPGASTNKVYRALKDLFREVDAGSPPASGLKLFGYNGELFKDEPIIDHIELPDSLHDKVYRPDDLPLLRSVNGVWGLHVYDFWQELGEHLLGHVFEESLSDIVAMRAGVDVDLEKKLAERKKHGIFYTKELLSDFVAAGALRSTLASVSGNNQLEETSARLESLLSLKIVDLACGSGAFLVSAYRELLKEFFRLRQIQEDLRGRSKAQQMSIDAFAASRTQATVLRDCLFGVDLLPQAVEIAKLALWLRSAKKSEKVANLGGNLVAGDSLEVERTFEQLSARPASFDIVLGNPPWGGEVADETRRSACAKLGMEYDSQLDSWELFVALGLHALKEGGRMALVLPDTLFSPQKERTRRLLLRETTLEKLHSLGPDWFGPGVRMGAVVLQAQKGRALGGVNEFSSVLLGGELRRAAIRGEVPLPQLEATLARRIPQQRCAASPTAEIEVFRSVRDDALINKMELRSVALVKLCERGRGEEMSKSGLVWKCPGCFRPTTPGEKRKGGGFQDKQCPACGLHLTEGKAIAEKLVNTSRWPVGIQQVAFVDGDDVAGRYPQVPTGKHLRLDLGEWQYKSASLYLSPKLLIRQAGVGLSATLDLHNSRCPQSIYVYRICEEYAKQGYSHEYVLGALLSRTVCYYILKRFAEIDPARAYAKVTHERLESIPIPLIDWTDRHSVALHDDIRACVGRILNGAPLGGPDDLAIERHLRALWGLTPEDGEYVVSELRSVPNSQALTELFTFRGQSQANGSVAHCT